MGATEWFWGLGNQYGVNPIVFGSIYVGAHASIYPFNRLAHKIETG